MTDLNLFKRANQTLEGVFQADKESRIVSLQILCRKLDDF